MQVQEQIDRDGEQVGRSDTQPQYHTAAPIHAEEPQAVTDLLAVADKENGQRKWLVVWLIWVAVEFYLFIAVPISPDAALEYSLNTLLLLIAGNVAFVTRYRNTTASLATVNDLRMVGPLIIRLRPGSKARHTRRVVMQALTRLLPRLKASDAALLSAKQKAELIQHLGRLAFFQQDKDFQVVILRALEQIGDAQAIPVVEAITQREPRSSEEEKVHRAAVECLPFLLARAEVEKARNTLLRSASGFAGDTGELLRAAGGGEGTDPHQLLRGDPQEGA